MDFHNASPPENCLNECAKIFKKVGELKDGNLPPNTCNLVKIFGNKMYHGSPFFGVWGRHHPLTQPNGTLWIPGCFNRFNRFNPEAYMASTSSWSQRFKSPPRSPKPIAGPLVVPSKPRERVMRSQSLQSCLAISNKNPLGNGLISMLFRGKKKSNHRSKASLKLTTKVPANKPSPKGNFIFQPSILGGELLVLGRVDGFKRFLVFLPQSLKNDPISSHMSAHIFFSKEWTSST